jgi:hypothetical protein
MSKCYDKALDLADTQKVMKGLLNPEQGELTWLRHEKKWAGYRLDLQLLRGVPDSELLRTRVSWRQHIDHLRYEHGLDVRRDERDYWKITGEAYTGGGKRSLGKRVKGAESDRIRNDITDEQYRAGYEMGRDVVLKEVIEAEALAQLVDLGINETSAEYMMVVTEGLMNGHNFTRAVKDGAYGWYLDWIYQDFGYEGLKKAVEGAKLHLAYRNNRGNSMPRLGASIERCERILNGEAPEPPQPPDDNDTRGGRGEMGRWGLVYGRSGQPEFRKNVLAAYNGRCAVTGTSVERLVEAAHVRPYSEDGESRVSNGILLRSDIHALFDASLLGIEPIEGESGVYRVRLSPSLLCEADYWKFNGQKVEVPRDEKLWPNVVELRKHLKKVNQDSIE